MVPFAFWKLVPIPAVSAHRDRPLLSSSLHHFLPLSSFPPKAILLSYRCGAPLVSQAAVSHALVKGLRCLKDWQLLLGNLTQKLFQALASMNVPPLWWPGPGTDRKSAQATVWLPLGTQVWRSCSSLQNVTATYVSGMSSSFDHSQWIRSLVTQNPKVPPPIVQVWKHPFGIQQGSIIATEHAYLYSLHRPFPCFLGIWGETHFLTWSCSAVAVSGLGSRTWLLTLQTCRDNRGEKGNYWSDGYVH